MYRVSRLAALAALHLAVCSGCETPTIRTYNNASNGVPLCIEDYDEETKGRFCTSHSPTTHARVLPVHGGNVNTHEPDVYLQCAHLCIAKGMHGTAGIENGYQCWCSNSTGPQGVPGNQSDCNITRGGLCPGDVWCGGVCRITQFAIVCPTPAAVPMSGGTIFLLSFSLVVVSYLVVGSVINHRRGEVGFDVIPQREFWGSMLRLIREGCLFSALACVGGTKAAFKVGHSTYTRYEQL